MKRPVRLTFFFILMGLGLGLGFYSWNRPNANTQRYQMLSTWGLGHYLAERFPGNRVLIVSNPFVKKDKIDRSIVDQEQSRIEGLQKGLLPGINSTKVVYPELKPGALEDPHAFVVDSQTTTPLSYLVTPDAFDDLIGENPETDILVSLTGLPANLDAVKIWQKKGEPLFAFLFPDFRFLGGADAVRQAVLSGKLTAFVFNKPGVDPGAQKVRKLNQKEFDRRFLIVHEANVDQVLQEWPHLFDSAP